MEPPTSGKVVLTTDCGDIDIELWCKECPKACRNFIQLCQEGSVTHSVLATPTSMMATFTALKLAVATILHGLKMT